MSSTKDHRRQPAKWVRALPGGRGSLRGKIVAKLPSPLRFDNPSHTDAIIVDREEGYRHFLVNGCSLHRIDGTELIPDDRELQPFTIAAFEELETWRKAARIESEQIMQDRFPHRWRCYQRIAKLLAPQEVK